MSTQNDGFWMTQKLSCKHDSTALKWVRRTKIKILNLRPVNEPATLDGVVFFLFIRVYKASDTVQGPLIIFFCGEHVPYTVDTTFFLEGQRKRVIINSMKRNLLKRLS